MTTHTITFTFEGEPGFTIQCDEDTDIVTAALDAGYILLSQCRQGACSTCKAFLSEGEYDELLPHPVHALPPNEEDEGFVLACRLEPRSDMVIDFDYPSSLIERLPAFATGEADR
jgi:methane monooxygenase component C